MVASTVIDSVSLLLLRAGKKLWTDDKKWAHDRYIEEYQKPKSREEIIALYGYDIRAHSEPPESVPMRRGRGRGR